MFLIIIAIVTGLAWFIAGKLISIAVATVLLLIWGAREMNALAARRQEREVLRYDRSRRIGRRGLPAGHRAFPGRERQHEPTDWCDGWCNGEDHPPSTVTYRRRDRHKENPGIANLDQYGRRIRKPLRSVSLVWPKALSWKGSRCNSLASSNLARSA